MTVEELKKLAENEADKLIVDGGSIAEAMLRFGAQVANECAKAMTTGRGYAWYLMLAKELEKVSE